MKTQKEALAGALLFLVVLVFLAGCAAPLADKATYGAAVLSQVQRASTGIATLSGLVSSPQPTDPAWREEVDRQLADLRAVVAEARSLNASEALAGPHQSYLDAMAQLDRALTSVKGALAASDPAQLREAVPLLTEAQTLLTAAQGLIGG